MISNIMQCNAKYKTASLLMGSCHISMQRSGSGWRVQINVINATEVKKAMLAVGRSACNSRIRIIAPVSDICTHTLSYLSRPPSVRGPHHRYRGPLPCTSTKHHALVSDTCSFFLLTHIWKAHLSLRNSASTLNFRQFE